LFHELPGVVQHKERIVFKPVVPDGSSVQVFRCSHDASQCPCAAPDQESSMLSVFVQDDPNLGCRRCIFEVPEIDREAIMIAKSEEVFGLGPSVGTGRRLA
jgi:hypothetical protein